MDVNRKKSKTRTGTALIKWTTLLLLLLYCLWLYLNYKKFDGYYWSANPLVYAAIILSPLFLLLLIKFIFIRTEEEENEKAFILLLSLLLSVNLFTLLLAVPILSGIATNPITKGEKVLIKQRKIEAAVQKWIGGNAAYPETYQSISFYNYDTYCQYGKGGNKYIKNSDIDTNTHVKNKKNNTNPYFIEHNHIIMDRKRHMDTVTAYFQLSHSMQVTDVRTQLEYNTSNPDYKKYYWRDKYGNDQKNLELEINGNTGKTYGYRFFNDKFVLHSIIPFSNGKINGTFVRLTDDGDTSAIVTYKNGLKNGITRELCGNKTVSFLGYCINGSFYGKSTWWYCNGQKSEEGVRIKDRYAGKWTYWDTTGKLIQVKDYGNYQLLDSLRNLLP